MRDSPRKRATGDVFLVETPAGNKAIMQLLPSYFVAVADLSMFDGGRTAHWPLAACMFVVHAHKAVHRESNADFLGRMAVPDLNRPLVAAPHPTLRGQYIAYRADGSYECVESIQGREMEPFGTWEMAGIVSRIDDEIQGRPNPTLRSAREYNIKREIP